MYIESRSAKVFIIILGIIAVCLVGFMINEAFDNLQSATDREEIKEQQNVIQTVTNSTSELTRAIHESDIKKENLTQHLLKEELKKNDRNYLALLNATEQTNQLVKFLTDNFGKDSGYIERENFQYQQANKTYDYLKQAIENQHIIMSMLNKSR